MSRPPYEIFYTREAERGIRKLDESVRRIVRNAIEALSLDPEKGKPLSHSLAGVRSLRAADYRIVYRIEDARLVIIVIAVGHRRDVYRRLEKLVKRAEKK